MRKILLAALGVGVAATLLSTVAGAQTPGEIAVEASRIVSKTASEQPAGGAVVKDILLSYGVSYSGLDLGATAGVAELERRVNAAANKACVEIGRQYPFTEPSDEACAKITAVKAMVKVRALVDSVAKAALK